MRVEKGEGGYMYIDREMRELGKMEGEGEAEAERERGKEGGRKTKLGSFFKIER